MLFEFKKWGNGSSCYEVIFKSDYYPLSKTFKYKSLGLIQKQGTKWVALHDGNQVAKTRQALAEDLKKQWEATLK
jgi:hypothetical protein